MHHRWVLLLVAFMSVGELSSLANTRTSQEVRILWQAYIGAPPLVVPGTGQDTPTPMFIVIERQQSSGIMPRQRSSELSSEQLLVVSVDAQGQERSRYLIPDPRILRAESPGPTGELMGEVLHRSTAEFVVMLPDDPTITEVRFYHPRWTGAAFTLELAGVVSLQ